MPRVRPFPDGHFYSPTIDFDEAERDQARIWPVAPLPPPAGIPFDDAFHHRVLTSFFPTYAHGYDYADSLPSGAAEDRFYSLNSQFGWLDSRVLFVLMRALEPARIIEVGSGYSSLLMADVNRRFLNKGCEITCIEPYPRKFLRAGIPGITALVEKRVQDVEPSFFDRLHAGDMLFIDSSHVSKTGSDVNYLYFEVLPRLRPGVFVHIHDVFLPHEYPKDWIFEGGRSWNEQYVVRALLMYSSAFKVRFGSSYAYSRYPDLVAKALGRPEPFGGGSLWIEVLPHVG